MQYYPRLRVPLHRFVQHLELIQFEQRDFELGWLLDNFSFDDQHATYAPLSERKHKIHRAGLRPDHLPKSPSKHPFLCYILRSHTIPFLSSMFELLLTSPLSLAVSVGILVTAALGSFCGSFLDTSVTVKFPAEFEDFEESEKGGGGKELGILERLLFFVSAWLGQYVIAVGWLTFKAAVKWASWQHITKVPETLKEEGSDERKYMDARRRLSSRLLGRFLNGTLYNIFCAGVGWGVGNLILEYYRYTYGRFLPANLWYWNFFVLIGVAYLIGRPLIGSPAKLALAPYWKRFRGGFFKNAG